MLYCISLMTPDLCCHIVFVVFFCRLAGGPSAAVPAMACYDVLSPNFQNNSAILHGQAMAATTAGVDGISSSSGSGGPDGGTGGSGAGGSGGGGQGTVILIYMPPLPCSSAPYL